MSEPVKIGKLAGTFQPIVPVIDDTEAEAIHALLKKAPPWLTIPAHLKPAFGIWRSRDLVRYVRVGSLPVWALNLVLTLVGYSQHRHQVQSGDISLWMLGMFGMFGVVTLDVLLLQLPVFQRNLARIFVPSAALVLAKMLATQQLLTTPGLVFDETFFGVITVTLVAVAARLTLLQSLCTLLAGGILAQLVVLVYAPLGVKWHHVYYYVVSSIVSLFIAWQLEEKEKFGYLQAMLIGRAARYQEQVNLELSRLAHQDGLSGLPNRREFDRRVTTEWERMRREQRPLALLFIDIDNFKAYNDHYGHAAGDECLIKIGRTIAAALLRPADVASRYGGEEFVIILPDTDLAGAMDVARRVLAAVDGLAIPHDASSAATHVTVSIGVAATVPSADDSADSLVQAADHAMYAAKHAGRHTIRSE